MFADWKFICSAKQVGFLLSFMIGILQNFLEGYDTKYFKALLLQFSIWIVARSSAMYMYVTD